MNLWPPFRPLLLKMRDILGRRENVWMEPERQLVDGSPVSADHREINPQTGMQKGYVVLSPEERAKGFIRPVRDAYEHLECRAVTRMHRNIAETYATDPTFYSGTYCGKCGGHYPVGPEGEFVWSGTDELVGT